MAATTHKRSRPLAGEAECCWPSSAGPILETLKRGLDLKLAFGRFGMLHECEAVSCGEDSSQSMPRVRCLLRTDAHASISSRKTFDKTSVPKSGRSSERKHGPSAFHRTNLIFPIMSSCILFGQTPHSHFWRRDSALLFGSMSCSFSSAEQTASWH